MKKIVIPVVAAGLSILIITPSDAQFVVSDPIHTGAHIAQFGEHLARWKETINNFQVIKDAKGIANVTKEISGEVRDLTNKGLELQQQIREDLKKVNSIVDLRISNPEELFARALALSGSSGGTDFMPSFSKAARLRQALQNGDTQEDIKTVFSVFSRTAGDIGSNTPMSAREYTDRREESAVSAYAYEEMAQKKKIETAFNYYKIADEMTEQSIELNATLKNPGRYSMTEGERMAMIQTSNDNMIKAMQMRQEADRLMAEAAQRGPAHAAAEMVYTDLMAQKALIEMDNQRRQVN